MNKILLFLLLSTNVILRSEESGTINDEEGNLFRSINQQIQDVVNKIFVLLGLSKNLSVKYDNRLLLALHASLKKSSEKKYSTYKRLREMAKLDEEYKVNSNNSLFVLDKPINEIIRDDYTMYDSGRKSAKQSESESIEIPENPEEAHLVLRNYLLNAENVELADIVKPFKKITEIADKHELVHRAIRRNFKVWKADNSSVLFEGTRRVFDGEVVSIIKFPFVASIHVDGEFVCTGSIISREMIITAASCLQAAYYNPDYLKDKPGGVFVRVGSEYPDRGGDLVGALSIHFNPLYRASALRNNLAIIRIKKHLHLRRRNKRIRRIEYKLGSSPTTGTGIDFLGWGDKDAADSGVVEDNRLRHARLNVIDLKQCMETYTTTYVSDRNFCAAKSEKSTGACQRDIGGPGILNSQLVGVISFSPPVCGTTDASTVFTSISYHINWIDSIVNNDKRKPLPPTVVMVTHFDTFFTSIPGPTTIANDELLSMNVINTENTSPQPKATAEEKTNENDTDSRKAVPESHYPKAMHLLSYALRQIMEKSYEWKDDKLLNSHELMPTTDHGQSLAKSDIIRFKNMKQGVHNDHSLPTTLSDKNDSKEKIVVESDTDSFESDEKGLSIEYKPTKFTDVTDGTTDKEQLKNLLESDDYPQTTIKNFVKSLLKPLKKQSPDFERDAEKLFNDNFVKDGIAPMNNSQSELDRIKTAISEYLYGKPRKSQNNKASNELVLMLLKQDANKDARNRFGVTNNNNYGDLNEKSDIKDFVRMSKDDYKKSKEKKNNNTQKSNTKSFTDKKINTSVASTEPLNKLHKSQNSKTEEPDFHDNEQHNVESEIDNGNMRQLVYDYSVPDVVTVEDITNPVETLTTAATSEEDYVFFRSKMSTDNYKKSLKSGRRSFLDYFDLS